MSTAAKLGLPALGAAILAVGAGVFLSGGGEQIGVSRVGDPDYRLSGINLVAAQGCAGVVGCTADVWAAGPDGGVVRLQVRAGDAGQFLYLDGGALDLEADGGGLVPRP